MSNITKVSASEEPDDDREPVRNKYAPKPFIDVRIPAEKYDAIRMEAYYGTAYPNTATEEQVLHAVDAEIFRRVQESEVRTLERAADLLSTEGKPALVGARNKPNALLRAQEHLDELSKIRSELRQGKTATADLAARYERVRKAMGQDGRSLVALSDKATKLRETVADPWGYSQKLLTSFQLGDWRPLGIHKW